VTSAADVAIGDKVYLGTADTGTTVTAINGNTITLSGAIGTLLPPAANITFKHALSMTLITPEGN
jgi:hypothetical protein